MVGLDASVWVASLLTDESTHAASHRWLYGWASRDRGVVVPRLFIAEVGAAVARRTRRAYQRVRAITRVRTEPLIDIRDLSRMRWDRVADAAAQLQLRAADAVYVVLAEELDLTLVTWDREILDHAADVVDVRTPDQVPIWSMATRRGPLVEPPSLTFHRHETRSARTP